MNKDLTEIDFAKDSAKEFRVLTQQQKSKIQKKSVIRTERSARACESTKIARPNYNKSDGASDGARRPHVVSSHADARINPRYHCLFTKVSLVTSIDAYKTLH